MKLLANPIRLTALVVWAGILIALLASTQALKSSWLAFGGLGALLLAILLARLFNARYAGEPVRRFARAMVVAIATTSIAFGSLWFQNQLNTAAVQQLGDDAYFASSEITVELVDAPGKVNQVAHRSGSFFGQPAASETSVGHAKLLTLAGKPIPCSRLPISCAPRGRITFAVTGQAAPKPGDLLAGMGFIKPGKGRDAFELRLTDWKLNSVTSVWSPLHNLRAAFIKNLSGVSAEAKSLVAGLSIGVVDEMPNDLRSNMQITGLTHLTAVSGANCAIVIGLIWWLLSRSRLGRRGRLIGSMLALIVYVLLVGQQPSVLRAAVMLAAVLFSRFLGRGVEAIDALAAAIVVLLVFDPWLATDLGFLLSVLATVGLVMLSRPIGERLASGRIAPRVAHPKILQAVSVVLAAQVLCLPVIIGLSGALPLYTLPANLLAEPLVAPVTVVGMAAVVTSFVPGLSTALTWVASIPAQLIAWNAKFFANLPGASWPWPAGALGIVAALIICIAAANLLLGRKARGISFAALAVVSAASLAFGLAKPIAATAWDSSGASVVMCDVGQGDAMVVRSQGQVALVDVGPDPEKIDACLKRLAVQRIDLLVLTHFDQDHVGGILGAIRGRRVLAVLETPWPDTRPIVGFIDSQVKTSGAELVLAQQGLSGELGELSWQVLSPSKAASEAEDSNDGSIVLTFSAPEFNLLALADLGERGQMRLVENNPQLVSKLHGKPFILKVAHHGSADMYPELYEALSPEVALVGVGIKNGYGHPTQRALKALSFGDTRIFRTDTDGSIAITVKPGGKRTEDADALSVSVTGGG